MVLLARVLMPTKMTTGVVLFYRMKAKSPMLKPHLILLSTLLVIHVQDVRMSQTMMLLPSI